MIAFQDRVRRRAGETASRPPAHEPPTPAATLLALQGTAGNRAVSAMLSAGGQRVARVVIVDQVDKKVKVRTLEDLKRETGLKDSINTADFFNKGSPDSWVKRVGKAKAKNADARAAWADEMYNDFLALLKDDYEPAAFKKQGNADDYRNIFVGIVGEYRRNKSMQAQLEKSIRADAEKKAEKDDDEDEPPVVRTDGIPSGALELYLKLVATRRVFTADDLRAVAKRAIPGSGQLFEMQLALRTLGANPEAFAMFGKYPFKFIADLMPTGKARLLEPERRSQTSGNVGSDVTFWYPAANGGGPKPDTDGAVRQYGAAFVQAKSVKMSSFAGEADGARNQLEGECANRGAAHGAEAREVTLGGKGYRGIIYMNVWDKLELGAAKSVVDGILLASKWVDEFVIEDNDAIFVYARSQEGKVVERKESSLTKLGV